MCPQYRQRQTSELNEQGKNDIPVRCQGACAKSRCLDVYKRQHYNYWRDRAEHEVWFEDARSVRAKLALAGEYQLTGVSIWNIMRYFPQLWLVLNSLYDIEKLG